MKTVAQLISAHEFSYRRHRFDVIAEYLKGRQDRNGQNHP